MDADLVSLPGTLSPLPPILQRGLIAVSFFGFLSFLTSVALFLRLAYRLVTWKRKTQARVNQFIILIFNLVFADIQQSVAFLLNAQWLRENAISVHTPICRAQGWFVSTGDLASGVFTLAIAVHSFTDIVWDYRIGHKCFLATIAALWAFVYACAIIGVALHPDDFYVRAGAWCWINHKYTNERLWLHYFWVIISEFGTVIVYTLIFLILRRRVKESFYTTSNTQIRAQSAAKLIIAYPVVYVVCTLPLVIARLAGMAGADVSFVELCVAGAMITSNGWLDVLLYTLTRRALLFGPDMTGEHGRALDTFRLRPDQAYGTTTTIEASNLGRRLRHSRHGSTEELFGLAGVKAETTVQVRIDAIELDSIGHHSTDLDLKLSRVSLDSRSQKSGK
ncbi:hypothetical protein LTR36_005542 [Oleoguttula mirabilis]|uniref:G-protein coupled receptors family 1 profile domain-containing protein n=1 Tax=Oleoguttula mirabilis TaxID=1507867 RepID=A0AAV9JE48_9PEZI|nr:hypothetical protein LTR36_005542 [Oleoguttula mirabilis]